MVIKEPALYGLLARFANGDALLLAAQKVRAAGYRRTDAYSPFRVEGLAEVLGQPRHAVAPIVLTWGILGALGGFFMCWFANVINYPLNIGGRPFNSWPAFIAITFEATVLCAGLSACLGMLILNRLPQPYHPVFNVPAFRAASRNGFFLCIQADDPQFDLKATRAFLQDLGPSMVVEVLG